MFGVPKPGAVFIATIQPAVRTMFQRLSVRYEWTAVLEMCSLEIGVRQISTLSGHTRPREHDDRLQGNSDIRLRTVAVGLLVHLSGVN